MDNVPLVTSTTILQVPQFWSAALLYHNRPHLVNRKLAASSQLYFCEISTNFPDKLSEFYARETLLYEIRKLADYKEINAGFVRKISEKFDNDLKVAETTWSDFNLRYDGIFISFHALYARYHKSPTDSKCIEVVILDKKRKTATFHSILEQNQVHLAPPFPYHLELTNEGNLRIILDSFQDADTNSAEWLADKLFAKLLNWAQNEQNNDSIKSLSLIESSEETYCLLYHQLKDKYGNELVSEWNKYAGTDASKFVFEDLAIAAYLICLWQTFQQQKDEIYFVDCGCGNGLLVYILNCEGYKGHGLDVRKRKVWDLFRTSNLQIGTVTSTSLYPQATWIIGNHSDELTPWIPVIALKSSPKTNYFVLPCCPYDFNGRKYVRTNTAISQYSDYMNYIKKVSELCWFQTHLDKLRIPSTKRTCLVGIRDENCAEDTQVNEFIKSRVNNGEVVVRNGVEKVRNCTQLNKDLIRKIVNLVVDNLLAVEKMLSKSEQGLAWNEGGTINLSDLSKIIPSADLKSLKNECGGLQTLLKNHGYIFLVKKGQVSLNKPRKFDGNMKYRDKPCWFFNNHPNGCLYSAATCASKH